MTPKRFMIVAGETSGDTLGAELVRELRLALERRSTYSPNVQPVSADLAPRFFGAGGPRMAEAGVELAFDLTKHAVIGLPGPRDYLRFRRLMDELVTMAIERQPHYIVCVDFPLFNAIFAARIKKYVRARRGTFNNWEPKVIKYISPQIWASREGRAREIARDFDLLISIFPFEKDWYAARVPKLRVEFVGHPMMDRYASAEHGVRNAESNTNPSQPLVVLLPGSRSGELRRHLPPMLGALRMIQAANPSARSCMVLPSPSLIELAKTFSPPVNLEIRCGGLAETLRGASIAMASTGTVTMELAYFGVPSVTFYVASWLTYQIGKRIVKVKSLTMPNILANEPLFPEFVQHDVTEKNLGEAALGLLSDVSRRTYIKSRLAEIIASLGGPGASHRAAEAILRIDGAIN